VDVTVARLPGVVPESLVMVVRPVPASAGPAVDVAVAELIESLDDGVLCLDAAGMVVLANTAVNGLHGLAPNRSLVGSPLPMVSALRTEDGQVLAHDHHPGLRVLRDGSPVSAHLTLGDDQEGLRHITVSARPFPVAAAGGALVVFHETTAEWREQQRLTHYALHDPLTNLANRYLLLEELRRMLQGLGRRGGSVALVFLDLDNFKKINDHFGHDVGDEVLTAVARRLKGAVRVDDVVARLGGDEFVIAHASNERLVDGDMVVSRIRKVLSAPFRVRGEAFDVGASIGWVSTDTGDIGPDALLAKADRAMYRHKRDRAVSRHGGE
jgi:diguanylate cyclase (GGDEF)-like protein